MLFAALPLNAFCPSAALPKHITSGPAYSKHKYVHVLVGEEGKLMIWEREVFSKFFFFFFSSYDSVQKKSEDLSLKLSSDTKGQPVVLLPRYNWMHCELSTMFSLPVCMCLSGPSADMYKLMQYAKMKAVPQKGFNIRSWRGFKPMLSMPGAVHYVAWASFRDLISSIFR